MFAEQIEMRGRKEKQATIEISRQTDGMRVKSIPSRMNKSTDVFCFQSLHLFILLGII